MEERMRGEEEGLRGGVLGDAGSRSPGRRPRVPASTLVIGVVDHKLLKAKILASS